MNYLERVSIERKELLDRMKGNLDMGHLTEDVMVAIPTLVLTLPIEHHDDNHRAGYAVMVSQSTFLPMSASWYRADGEGTYRESRLNDEEFQLLLKYYAKHFTDVWSKFCKCVID